MSPQPPPELEDPRAAALMASQPAGAPEDPMPAIEASKDPATLQAPLTEKADPDDIAEWLYDNLQEYKRAREGDLDNGSIENYWRMAENSYMGIPDYDIPYGVTYYQLREVKRQVDTMNALFIKRFLDQRMFELRARHYGDEDMAEIAASHMRWQIRALQILPELRKWCKQKRIYGTSFLQVGWRFYRGIQFKKTRVDDGAFKPVWKNDPEEQLHRGPFAKYIDHSQIYLDTSVDDIWDSGFVFKEELVSDEYILTQMRDGLFDYGQVRKALAIEGTETELENPATNWRAKKIDNTLLHRGSRILVTAWTNGGLAYAYIENGGTRHCVQANKNIYGKVPILAQRNSVKPGYFYGEGDPMILAPQDRMLKDVVSLGFEALQYENRPCFIANATMYQQFSRMKFLSGEVLKANSNEDMEGVRALRLNDGKTRELLSIVQGFVLPQMEATTSVTKEVSGSGSDQRTSSGQRQLRDAAQTKLDMDVMDSAPEFEKFWGFMYQLNARFETEVNAMAIDGPDGRKITGRPSIYGAEVFSPQVDVEIQLADNMIPPDMLLAKLMQMWQAITAGPTASLWNLKPMQICLARVVQGMCGGTRPSAWIADPSTSQQDAMDENENWDALGTIWEVSPHDNHQMHIQVHLLKVQAVSQSPEFLALAPEQQKQKLGQMMAHIQQHQFFAAQMQQGMPGGSPEALALMGGVQDQLGDSGQAMGNELGNAMNGNAMQGAAQQGRMAG